MGDRAADSGSVQRRERDREHFDFQHKDVVVYKYGCSDTAFQNLGGTQLLLWKTIVEAKASGLTCMDFGRSDADNPGLIAFKDRWGAKSSGLTYLRWSRSRFPT